MSSVVEQAKAIKAKNDKILEMGAKSMSDYCSQAQEAPPAESGLFAREMQEWKPNTSYKKGELFSYKGNLGYTKQSVSSLEIYPPFTVGTEALYGARSMPDADGVYPYVYNMAADVGMKVLDPTNNTIYECYQAINDMLFAPHDIPAHFKPFVE